MDDELRLRRMPFNKYQAHSLCRPPIREKNESFLMVAAHGMCLLLSFVERTWPRESAVVAGRTSS